MLAYCIKQNSLLKRGPCSKAKTVNMLYYTVKRFCGCNQHYYTNGFKVGRLSKVFEKYCAIETKIFIWCIRIEALL